jgi:hypothetical protein
MIPLFFHSARLSAVDTSLPLEGEIGYSHEMALHYVVNYREASKEA